jgi:predicted nucleic acid-binding protein
MLRPAKLWLGSWLLATGSRSPQILAEFIHVVTDPRRFAQPLQMDNARHLAQQWWTAREVDRVFPNEAATQQFLAWLGQFSLGRKRLLDTLLAATYHQAGIRSILTTNPSDLAPSDSSTALRLALRHRDLRPLPDMA